MIEILLATYNGAAFLAELLSSLETQSYPNWTLVVRDDGSCDSTLAILAQWSVANPSRLKLVESGGNRLGAAGSFSALLQQANADYVAFCDQDDVWKPERLAVAMAAMREAEGTWPLAPVLVHSDLEVVDRRLKTVSPSLWRYHRAHPHYEDPVRVALRNSVTGCTVTMNRRLVELVTPLPTGALMHDWWVAITASAFGKVIPVNCALVRYRQHEANEVGAQRRSFLSTVRKGLQFWRCNEIRRGLQASGQQAGAFVETFGPVLPRQTLRRFQALAALSGQSPFRRRLDILRFRLIPGSMADLLGLLVRV